MMRSPPAAHRLAVAALGALSLLLPSPASAQAKVKVGLMLPYSGTYAALGNAITNGFKLAVAERGGKLGGREVEYFVVDDESDPAKAPDNASKLVKRDQVDVLVGTVHSGVALAMAKVARDNGTLLIVPNAGAGDLTGPLCAPNIFRSSFTMWQSGYAMGKVAAEQKKRTAVTLTWKYAAGEESVGGFREAFEAGGGKIVKSMALPFPQVEFQSYLTEIAALKPDVVYVFFAGGGAVKFVKDYAAAGLKASIPLYGAGFLTDGTLEAQGEAALFGDWEQVKEGEPVDEGKVVAVACTGVEISITGKAVMSGGAGIRRNDSSQFSGAFPGSAERTHGITKITSLTADGRAG